MTTATDATRLNDERDRRIFESMVEHFTKTFRPTDDPYAAHQFDTMLFSLVRQIYRDAQQPLLDQITLMMASMSYPSHTGHVP